MKKIFAFIIISVLSLQVCGQNVMIQKELVDNNSMLIKVKDGVEVPATAHLQTVNFTIGDYDHADSIYCNYYTKLSADTGRVCMTIKVLGFYDRTDTTYVVGTVTATNDTSIAYQTGAFNFNKKRFPFYCLDIQGVVSSAALNNSANAVLNRMRFYLNKKANN